MRQVRLVVFIVLLTLAAMTAMVGFFFVYGMAHERAMTACTSTPPGSRALPASTVTVETAFPPWKFECVYWKNGKVVAKTRAG